MDKVIILAAGDKQRWGNYLGVPKHLIDIKGEPLLHRTARLMHERNCDVWVVAQPQDRNAFVPGFARWGEPKQIERSWVQEMEPSRHLWNPNGKTILLYGDCYFTEELLDDMLGIDNSIWHVYGRYDGSALTGKKWGEMWGWVFNPDHHRDLDFYRNLAIEYVDRSLWDRCLGWEIYRLAMGWLPWDHQTEQKYFVEWEDQTEDFDYPVDFETWAQLNSELVYN